MDAVKSTAVVARITGLMVPAGTAATLLAICAGLLLPDAAARRFVIFYVAPTLVVTALWLRERIAVLARDRRTVAMLDALAILVETTWFKLTVRNDPRSWLHGIADGGLMILVRIALAGAPRSGR